MNEKRTPMSEEARALASDPRHIRFAKKEAMVLAARTGADLDAMESAALFGLCRAAAGYDPASGFQFLTFAAGRIKGAMFDDGRNQRFGGRYHPDLSVLSIETPISNGSDDRTPIRDALVSDEDPIAIEDAFDAAEGIIRALPRRHREALRLAYLDASAGTGDAVARRLGCSRARVFQIQRESFAMIRGAQ